MDHSTRALRPLAAAVFAAIFCLCLAACGGGGSDSASGTTGSTGTGGSTATGGGSTNTGGGTNPGSGTGTGGGQTTTSAVSGTVATGAPVAGATVIAYEPNGTSCGTATTAADGTYTLNGTCTAPYLLAANTAQGMLLTPITSTQTNGSITPITTGILSSATGTASTSSVAVLAATLTTLGNGQLATVGSQVLAQLANLFPSYTSWASLNPFASFSANHTGVDAVLDQLALEVSGNTVTFINTDTSQQFTAAYSGGNVTVGSVTAVPNLASSSPNAWPATAQYLDYNYATTTLGSTSAPGAATFVDNGPTAGTAALTTPAASNVAMSLGNPMTFSAQWSAGIGFDWYSTDYNAPSVLMLCGAAVPNDGTNGDKSWDVLLPANAVPVTNASQVMGLAFTRFYEDCYQGGTYPATTAGNYLSFDGSGNASFSVMLSATQQQSYAVPASQFFAGPVSNVANSGWTVQWSLYRYTTAAGLVRYAVVEHGLNPAGTGASSHYIGLWLQ